MSKSQQILKDYRKSSGMSRKQLAEHLSRHGQKITPQQVANWELSRTRVPGDVILEIIKAPRSKFNSKRANS